MRKIASILFAVFLFGVTLPALASPFSDLPADHWATQAVKVLAEKGLVEGYPDGTFKGDRAATRYEVAMIVARLVAYLEKQKPQVTKEDLDAIRQLVDEYKDELDAMGVRLKNVEDTLANLEGRVKKLEAIKVSGAFESRFYTNGLTKTNNSATLTPFKFDALAEGSRVPDDQNAIWNHVMVHNTDNDTVNNDVEGYPMNRLYTVVPTESGTSLTEAGYLKVSAKLSDDYTAGGVVSLYNNQGDLGNGYTFGVTVPTLNNPVYNANEAFSPFTNNLNASLEQIFVVSEKDHLNAVVGDWQPAYMPDQLLKGAPNPGVYGPDYLPFYGGQLYGNMTNVGNGVTYELVAGKLPAGATLWQNEVFGADAGYEWKTPADISVRGGVVRALNDSASLPAGTCATTGCGVDSPGGWVVTNPTPGLPPVGIGPQQETLYGIDASIKFGADVKWLTFWAKYGNSQYNGNHASNLYSTVGGNLYDVGFNAGKDGPGSITANVSYLRVEPTYDPFVAEMNVATAAFSGPIDFYSFPYPVSYGPPFTGFLGFNGLTNPGSLGDVFYNVHDARKYPDNRLGYRINLNWNYGRGNLGGGYENLDQTLTSTPSNEFNPGFYEPVFFTIPGLASSASPGKGNIKTWNAHADYTVPSKELTLSAIWIQNQIRRPELDANNINLQISWWRAGLVYRPAGTDLWNILAGVDGFLSNGAGQYLQAPTKPGDFLFRENGGYVGVNYNFTQNASAWILYNILAQHDNTNGASILTPGKPASNFNGNSLSSGLRFLF